MRILFDFECLVARCGFGFCSGGCAYNLKQSMGQLFHSPQEKPAIHAPSRMIADIYRNFHLSNQVILSSLRTRIPPARRFKATRAVLARILEPFWRVEEYSWGGGIAHNFSAAFLGDFQLVWSANREQFYEVLLINCRVDLKDTGVKGYQTFFYSEAIHALEETMPESSVDGFVEEQVARDLAMKDGESRPKAFGQMRREGVSEETHSTLKIAACSLLMPETIFTDRLSPNVRREVRELLRFYLQIGDSLSQVLHCNSLISCPLKHFLATLQQKLERKRITQSRSLMEEQLSTTSEQTRRMRRTRETNNNFLLLELRTFLEAYTEFVWEYLQLELLAHSRFERIVNHDILYGLVLKSVWTLVDWILQRGFQYQQAKLEQYLQFTPIRNDAGIEEETLTHLQTLMLSLRDETHPQQYLKKVAVLYGQASKLCSDADALLLIYEETLIRVGQGGGSKRLHLFRMRNVVDKLMRLDDSWLNGGEINYSWTTWCVMVEHFRQRIESKYGVQCASNEARSMLDRRASNSLIVEAPLLSKCLSL